MLNDPANLIDPDGRAWKRKWAAIIAALEIIFSGGESRSLGREIERRAKVEETLRRGTEAERKRKGTPADARCIAPLGQFKGSSAGEFLGDLWEVLADINNDGQIDVNDLKEWLNPDPFFSWEQIEEMTNERYYPERA